MRYQQDSGNLVVAGAALNPSADSQGAPVAAAQGFGVPVALFNFNRPQLTRSVFEVVRRVKPRRLLLVADGPRSSRADDARLCAEVRAIFDEIDWECEVSRNFSETNLGSFKRNSSGLDWVFDTVEEAIILEDDCVPALSFFRFCEELLERYRDDPRVGVISGNNFSRPTGERTHDSYLFSAYALTWGWASWRRVWKEVDLSMSWWEPEAGEKLLRSLFPCPAEWKYWYALYERIRSGENRNAWDYQLMLTLFRHSRYCAFPRVNLISNIGAGVDATNCTDDLFPPRLPSFELGFPLVHPTEMRCNKRRDRAIFHARFHPSSWQWARFGLIRAFRRTRRKIGLRN